MSTNDELLASLRQAYPQLFSSRDEDGEVREVLDLEKIRLLAGEGNYSDHYGLRWEDKPEKFDEESKGKLPSLKHITGKRISTDPTKPSHVLIQGDNYHALKVLAYTHERSVDVIYIDPPYNTGNQDFKYNDRFVDREDGYRHSKWLSFMAKRLRLAKLLLKETGIIFISIDSNEQAGLTLLCDEIFGESNRLSGLGELIWYYEGVNDNNAFLRKTHEHVLAYTKTSKPSLSRSLKDPNVELPDAIENSVVKNGPKNPPSEVVLPVGFPCEMLDGFISKAKVKAVTAFDDFNIKGGCLNSPVRVLSGWSSKNILLEFIASGFKPVLDSKGQATEFFVTPSGNINYRKVRDQAYVLSVLRGLGTVAQAGDALAKMGLQFSYPKPLGLLKYLISMHSSSSSVVLDFFAGSGTTGHAVMQLNSEDGGNRQCILVTNDEGEFKDGAGAVLQGGICTNVTYPRLKKVIEGYTPNKGKAVAGFGENLEFFETSFLPVPQSRDQLQAFVRYSASLLQLKAGCFTTLEQTLQWSLHTDGEKHLFVLFDDCAVEKAFERLKSVYGPIVVYVFAYECDDDSSELLSQHPNVSVQEVPQPLLDLFFRVKD